VPGSSGIDAARAAPPPPDAAPARHRLDGVGAIVRFNWPLYALGFVVAAAGLTMALVMPAPLWLRVLAGIGGGAALYLLAASLAVSYWVYDHSPLYRFDWVKPLIGPEARRLANVHTGFDESSIALRRLNPDAELTIVDLYDPARMTEASIRRARRWQARTAPPWLAQHTVGASIDALPLATGTIDAVFGILALHEVRAAEDRRRLFAEIARALRPGGRLILAEHARDWRNGLVFGPQVAHFYPARTWLRLAEHASLRVVERARVTPFVGVLVFEKPA